MVNSWLRIGIIISFFVIMGCGVQRKSPEKKVKAYEIPEEKKRANKEYTKRNYTPSNKKDTDEAYYQKYIPVNRSDLPYKQRILSYVDEFSGIAIQEMRRYHIPASITLAQGILESAAGIGVLAMKSNNHFGIKCHDWTGQSVSHDDDEEKECFRKYKHPKESYEDHSKFLSNRSRYQSLFDLPAGDYKAWAKGLKSAGYATDPEYSNKLIRIIETYNLNLFDDFVLLKKENSENKKEKPKLKKKIDKAYNNNNNEKKKKTTTTNEKENNNTNYKSDNTAVAVVTTITYPTSSNDDDDDEVELERYKIKYDNKVNKTYKKTHIVQPKETLYSLSKKYNVSIEKLIEMNNVIDNKIYIDQEFIIEK